MVTKQQRRLLIAVGLGLGLVILVVLYVEFFSGSEGPTMAAGPSVPTAGSGVSGDLPRIGLDRVTHRPAHPGLGKRDIFDFPPPPPPPPTPPPPVMAEASLAPVVTVPTPIPPPPVTVKYIGSLEAKPGLKVAFFMTEQKEVLTGQAGQTVMNRFRIVRIGIESVDVQDVAANNQVRRIPLRAN